MEYEDVKTERFNKFDAIDVAQSMGNLTGHLWGARHDTEVWWMVAPVAILSDLDVSEREELDLSGLGDLDEEMGLSCQGEELDLSGLGDLDEEMGLSCQGEELDLNGKI